MIIYVINDNSNELFIFYTKIHCYSIILCALEVWTFVLLSVLFLTVLLH